MIGLKRKNFSYKIPQGEEHAGAVLWSGRYTCIAAFIYKYQNGKLFVLLNKRGNGTPDFQGYWNAPCGFLEGDESGEQGCARETYEETGLRIDPNKFILHSVQTDPELCNNGNVTLRYYALLSDSDSDKLEKNPEGGEIDEVSDIGWVEIDRVNTLKMAFGHEILIPIFADIILSNETFNSSK